MRKQARAGRARKMGQHPEIAVCLPQAERHVMARALTAQEQHTLHAIRRNFGLMLGEDGYWRWPASYAAQPMDRVKRLEALGCVKITVTGETTMVEAVE